MFIKTAAKKCASKNTFRKMKLIKRMRLRNSMTQNSAHSSKYIALSSSQKAFELNGVTDRQRQRCSKCDLERSGKEHHRTCQERRKRT